jgi:hypothetical protein
MPSTNLRKAPCQGLGSLFHAGTECALAGDSLPSSSVPTHSVVTGQTDCKQEMNKARGIYRLGVKMCGRYHLGGYPGS